MVWEGKSSEYKNKKRPMSGGNTARPKLKFGLTRSANAGTKSFKLLSEFSVFFWAK